MTNSKFKFALPGLVLATLLLAEQPAWAASAIYRCPLGIDLVADYSPDAKTVTLYVQGQTMTLPIALSGSGAKYSDGKTTLWEHQGLALFEMPGASFPGCKAVPLR